MLNQTKITSYEEYHHILNSVSKKYDIKNIDYYIQKNKRLEEIMNMLPSAMLIGNYRTNSILFASKSIKSITGDDSQKTMNGTILEMAKRVHPDDLEMLSNYYLPKLINIVSGLSKEELKAYIFSCNYRVKRTDDVYIQILQRTTILETNEDNLPMMTMYNITDISNYKTDNKLVFTVSKFEEDNLIFDVKREVLGEDNLSEKLTNKEIQTLMLLSNGLSAKEIAIKQNVSEFTIKAHKRNIKTKLNIHKLTELVSYALSNSFHFSK